MNLKTHKIKNIMRNITQTNSKAVNGVASLIDELFSNEPFGSNPKKNFSTKSPFVNINETDDNFTLEFSIPGIKKEAVVIELDNEKLTVSAELANNTTQNTENYTRREFHTSSFKRSFILPDTIDPSKISAIHANGILEISIPKKEDARPKPVRTIKISE
ncbi:MAG: HSP20 family protein [Planctomycetota bacterium]